MVLPVLDGLTDLLWSITGGLNGLRSIYIDLLQEKFGDFYADEELCVATVVDPRFKDVLFGIADVITRVIDWTVIAAFNHTDDCAPRTTAALTAPHSPRPSTSSASDVNTSAKDRKRVV